MTLTYINLHIQTTMNTFGHSLRLTTFGESHGPAMGGVIDGFPPRFKIDFDRLNAFIATRKTGCSALVSQRRESDVPEFLSGISAEGHTLGTPIGFIIRNADARSHDYDKLQHVYRPGHADYTYEARYGIRDWRGGGRASARETVCRTVAGGIALQLLESRGITVECGLTAVGKATPLPFTEFLEQNGRFAFPPVIPGPFAEAISQAATAGTSIGGTVGCVITGMPPGIGNPVYDKVQAHLAEAMMTINAVKGFEYGSGFSTSAMQGEEAADVFTHDPNGRIVTLQNHSGGIQGGITNGMPIFFQVAFKPTPSIGIELPTVNDEGGTATVKVCGRHDPCVAVRGVAVVKAMAALTIADMMLGSGKWEI